MATLEPFREPLVDFDEWNDNAPLPDSVFDVPLFGDAKITCSEAFLNGGRITYNGKESHIMSVVNARLNKNVVRRAADCLLKDCRLWPDTHSKQHNREGDSRA